MRSTIANCLHWLRMARMVQAIAMIFISSPLLAQAESQSAFIRDERAYLRVSTDLLDRDQMLFREGGGGNIVFRLTSREGKVLMVIPPVRHAVGNAIRPLRVPTSLYRGLSPIVAVFEPTLREHDFLELDVTDVLMDAHELGLPGLSGTLQRSRSFVESVENLGPVTRVSLVKTFKDQGGVSPGLLERYGSPGQRQPLAVSTLSTWSFYILPKETMKARLNDPRTPYHNEYQSQIGKDLDIPMAITRFRLEKADPNAAVSKPKKPIVFYFEPGTPAKWKTWLRKGVLSWNKAFLAAGFEDAIEVREVDAADPTIVVGSPIHSFIRLWSDQANLRSFSRPEGMKGGLGTARTLIDPRSGEILKSDVVMALGGWPLELYFVSSAPLDPRVGSFPVDEELQGELLAWITAHETGHALGLRDGHYGEYAYPFEKMRDAEWLREMGHTPSVMNYARHNYIPQPEDNIAPELLIQKVGPADSFWIQYGYMELPHASDPFEEVPHLDALLAQQDSKPWLRFIEASINRIGPSTMNEVAVNDDPIASSKLGLLNLERVVEMIPRAARGSRRTSNEGGGSGNSLRESLYHRTLDRWELYMMHAATLIGGVIIEPKTPEQEGPVYVVIDPAKQRAALELLTENALNAPTWLYMQTETTRFEQSGGVERVLERQKRILSDLLTEDRLARIVEHQDKAEVSTGNYTIEDHFSGLSDALFSEYAHPSTPLDPGRAALQNLFAEVLMQLSAGAESDIVKMSVRAQSTKVEQELEQSLKTSKPGTWKYQNLQRILSLMKGRQLVSTSSSAPTRTGAQ